MYEPVVVTVFVLLCIMVFFHLILFICYVILLENLLEFVAPLAFGYQAVLLVAYAGGFVVMFVPRFVVHAAVELVCGLLPL